MYFLLGPVAKLHFKVFLIYLDPKHLLGLQKESKVTLHLLTQYYLGSLVFVVLQPRFSVLLGHFLASGRQN